jgi:hypothetical protein
MSLADNTSEAGLSDVLEADSDVPMSVPAYVPDAMAISNTESTFPPTPPPSPYSAPRLHELSTLVDHATQISKSRGVLRHTRSSARHKVYSLPSQEQRRAYKKHSRGKKDMFVEGPRFPFAPVQPTAVFHLGGLVLPTVDPEVVATIVNLQLSSRFATQCNVGENQCISTDSPLTPTLTAHDAPCATQKSGLTIKIPGPVDRLALRLLGSCSVTEQMGEDEDEDGSSLDGYSASESSSSSSEGDIDDNEDDTVSRSSSLSPDRSSRRKSRRSAAAPYHRTGGKSKRKELWVDTDTRVGGEVPAFLLRSPTVERPRTRFLRSGHVY